MSYAIFIKVEYLTEVFDLTVPQTAFEFIFQLYNFLSEAKADNDELHQPEGRLLEAKNSVARKGYTSLTTRKLEETGSSSHRSGGPPAPGGSQGSFGDQSVQRELTRAGYTLTQPISEELTLQAPVSCNSRGCTRSCSDERFIEAQTYNAAGDLTKWCFRRPQDSC